MRQALLSSICSLLFVLFAWSAQAQGLKLSGRVTETGLPAGSVAVRIKFESAEPFDTTLITAPDGSYNLGRQFQSGLQGGILLYSLTDCRGQAILRQRVWNSSMGFSVLEDFDICLDPSGNCRVNISAFPHPSGGFFLIAGGTNILSYEWSSGQTTEIISVAEGGRYCVTVTDKDGCRAEDCIDLLGTTLLRCQASISMAHSPNAGELILTAESRGIGPFEYAWSNQDTTREIRVKDPGTYCVTVTDVTTKCNTSACITARSYNFQRDSTCKVWFSLNRAPAGLVLGAQTNRPLSPVQYQWSTGATTERITVLNDGVYCVTATFNDGCVATYCAPVTRQGIGGRCTVGIEGELLDTTGLYRLTAIPESGNFQSVLWSNGSTQTTVEIRGPGTFCLIVIYESGCRAKRCISLEEIGTGGLGISEGVAEDLQAPEEINLAVYPNPVSATLVIKADGLDPRERVRIEIRDMDGRIRRTEWLNNCSEALSHRVDLSSLSGGSYLITLYQDKRRITGRFDKM